ncbi:hypothetical protein PR003_g10576 [Phytophthora rubi]|uniref:Uncharacterized protein n=1 Tax=Phytophthora rubi TaxID=129364 RepID=A0A6A3MB37_9STRA|nr:hypothetical protein PR002_g10129 [Phytophthora rubi]KAE9340279.1 hypothetical protein PR003_g10576 [Phytophthora rubi]
MVCCGVYGGTGSGGISLVEPAGPDGLGPCSGGCIGDILGCCGACATCYTALQ